MYASAVSSRVSANQVKDMYRIRTRSQLIYLFSQTVEPAKGERYLKRVSAALLVLPGALLLVTGWERRTLRYAACEDRVVGAHTVRLFPHGACEMAMGPGCHDGHDTLHGDTLPIAQREGPMRGLPAPFRGTPDHSLALPTAQYPKPT